jgi:hypothetical protein
MINCAVLNELRDFYKLEYKLDRTETPLADSNLRCTLHPYYPELEATLMANLGRWIDVIPSGYTKIFIGVSFMMVRVGVSNYSHMRAGESISRAERVY